MMHICPQEIFAALSLIPVLGLLAAWVRARMHHAEHHADCAHVRAPSWVGRMGGHVVDGLRWLAGEVKEKLDVVETVHRIIGYVKSHGLRFAVAAGIWETIEDVVCPFIAWKLGHGELIPLFLIFHAEPVVYPIFIYAFRTYDRIRGRVPWDPPRPVASTSTRSATKVLLYRGITIAIFWAVLARLHINMGVLTVYAVLMTLFAYVHERMWHDSSFGITDDDRVLPRRWLLKSLTYRATSAMMMAGAFAAFVVTVPWGAVALYQVLALGLYTGLEAGWAQSTWGIRGTGGGA